MTTSSAETEIPASDSVLARSARVCVVVFVINRKGTECSRSHITVSTVGILPGMEALARRPEQFRLAISLHAPTSAQRLGIMPIEKKYDLEAVLKAASAFRKRVTFEYVMIGGVNDRDADADRLAKLARRLGALVNILPLHPGGAPDLTPTPADRIRAFAARLRNQGIEATVRRSRGLDIDAACGQLRVATERKRREPAAVAESP